MRAADTNLRYHAEDEAYTAAYEVFVPSADSAVRQFVNEHIPEGDGECIEIGCSPGGYLTLFGALGYELSGIDFDPRIQSELPRWLSANGFRPGEFVVADFTTHRFDRQFDVVYSLGFIEHFTNWVEIIGRHMEMVKPGGYLLIGTPNYSGIFQRVLHKLFEEENYRTHVTASMNPELWREIFAAGGFEVLRAGTVGRFNYWSRGTERLPRIQQELSWLVSKLTPTLAQLPDTASLAGAAYLGVVGRRIAREDPGALLAEPDRRERVALACRSGESRDQETEQAAACIVSEVRAFLDYRGSMRSVVQDKIRRLVLRR